MVVTFAEPEIEDLNRILIEVAKVHAREGTPIVYVSRVPENSKPPSSQFSKALQEKMSRLLEHCESFHAVLEGSGFVATLKRTVVAAAFFASGKRHMFHVHPTVNALVRSLEPSTRAEVSLALYEAATKGMLRTAGSVA